MERAPDLAAAHPGTHPGAPAACHRLAAPVAGRVLDFGTLLAILGQYRWLLVFCVLAALATARIVLNGMPLEYTASAEVMLNNRLTRVVDLTGVLGAPGGHDLAATEQRILTSQRLLQQVIDRLHLDRDPEFNQALDAGRDALWPGRLQALAGPFLKIAAGAGRERPDRARAAVTTSDVASANLVRADVVRAHAMLGVIDRFRAAVRIGSVPRTRSITVSVTARDPAKAALIANTLADLYIVDQLETKTDATRRASAWLDQRLAEMKARVERSEAAVVAYRARQSLGPGQGREMTAQQIAELNKELITARAALAEAEARAGQVERRVSAGGIAAAAGVLSSDLILTLRTNLAALIRREAELSGRYGPRHPRMKDLKAEIADTRGAIAREVRKIVEGLKNDVAVARARTAALEAGLGGLEDKSVALSRTAVHLNQLEREASADRQIYENFLTRVRETREQENLQSADARVLSVAIPPLQPSGPNGRKIVALALALGLAAGLGTVVLAETTTRSVRAGAELSQAFGLPVLAILPRLGRLSPRRLLRRTSGNPSGRLARAADELATATLLRIDADPPRVVAVMGSVRGEEAPAAALLLAEAAGRNGARVLLVDTDLEHPRLARLLGQGEPGFAGLLAGTCQPRDVVVADDAPGLSLLPAAPTGDRMVTHGRLARAIGRLRPDFDLIVLDGPPVLATADAAVVGRVADAVVYAVRWRRTPRDAIRQGLERLAALGVQPAGFVLTATDQGREARHAFARYGTGYGYLAAGRD